MVENLFRDLDLVGHVGFLGQKKLVEYLSYNIGLVFNSGLLNDSIKNAHLGLAFKLSKGLIKLIFVR